MLHYQLPMPKLLPLLTHNVPKMLVPLFIHKVPRQMRHSMQLQKEMRKAMQEARATGNVGSAGSGGHPRRECPAFLKRMNKGSQNDGQVAALKGAGKFGKGGKWGKGGKFEKGGKGGKGGKWGKGYRSPRESDWKMLQSLG